MSKRKSKAAPRNASKKPVKKAAKTVKRAAPVRRTAMQTAADDNGRTVQATVFIFRTGHGNKIRTSPQRIWANPGDRIEWTVVNMVDGSDVPVTITWPVGGPWGKDPIQFRGRVRQDLNTGATGRFKYVVSALDVQEDPEVEIPDI